jgi:hypothetical protein
VIIMEEAAVMNTELAVSSRFRVAHAKLAARIDDLADGELIAVNIDVTKAVTTVLGSNPEILALRQEMLDTLPGFDLSVVDDLETIARATGYAHALYLASSAPRRSLAELGNAVSQERALLMSDARALVTRKLIGEERLREFKGEPGYRKLAFEVMGLVALLREHWEVIAGKTAVQPEDLSRAAHAADELLVAVGLREQGPEQSHEATEHRQRAFTLLVKTYDEVRRGVGYLRWRQGDADEIAPSLYAGRGGRGSASPVSEEPAPDEPEVGSEPTPAKVPVGFPGGSPFTAS